MSKPILGDPKIDEEFEAFLTLLDGWTKKRLDNIDAQLLKKGLEKIGAFKGRLDGAVMTNLEQQIGAVKGEMRKKL